MTAWREFSSIKPGVLLERTEQRAQGPGEAKQRSGKLLLTESLASFLILSFMPFLSVSLSIAEQRIAIVWMCSSSLPHPNLLKSFVDLLFMIVEKKIFLLSSFFLISPVLVFISHLPPNNCV